MRKISITLFLVIYSVFYIKAQNPQSITNGFPIEIQNVPYQVSIQSDNEHFCGGSIINNRYVLTAAHCVSGVNANNITVSVGFSLQNNTGNNIQTFNVLNIAVHPNYGNSDFDVAVIEIDGTFNFNNYVQPIELISDETIFAESIGNEVRVSGWGWTTPGQRSLSNILQAVDVPIISNQTASVQLDVSYPPHSKLTQRMISTGAVGMDREGACHGDSGGPLVFKQNGQHDIQIGVVSWGVPRCVGEENSPSVYARLSELVSWIHSQVWSFVNIQGSNDVCNNSSKTYTVQNIPDFISITNWETSANLQILSSNNSEATIKATNNTSGVGWIRATLNNNFQITKNINTGSPSSNNLRITTTGNGIYLFSKTWQELFGFGGYDIEWNILGTSTLIRNTGSNSILVYPTSINHGQIITIGIRAKNECGYSNWKYQDFRIYKTTPDGGISVMH